MPPLNHTLPWTTVPTATVSAPASSCLSLPGAQFPHLHTEAADLTERRCGSLSVPASLTFPLLGSELPSVLLKPRGCNAHSLAVQASSGRCRPAPEGSAQSCFPVPGPRPHRRPNCACLQCQTLSQVGSPYVKQGRGPPNTLLSENRFLAAGQTQGRT